MIASLYILLYYYVLIENSVTFGRTLFDNERNLVHTVTASPQNNKMQPLSLSLVNMDPNQKFVDKLLQSNLDLFPDRRLEQMKKQKKKSVNNPKVWDRWGRWSSCSVTCGAGKMTRWRHCVSGGCASGEKEAQIKTCTNPAC